MKVLPLLFILYLPNDAASQIKNAYQQTCIGFYNVENLFDCEDDPITKDDDRTPTGTSHWTEERYHKKVANVAKVIYDFGHSISNRNTLAILGLAEIENRYVLDAVLQDSILAGFSYGIIHKDSPDYRGIDVALLYDTSVFHPKHIQHYPLQLEDPKTHNPRTTRDQLVVTGMLADEEISVIVLHWPSRRGGQKKSEVHRLRAAKLTRHIADSLHVRNPYAKIVIMGDLNDNPSDKSVRAVLEAKKHRKETSTKEFYNPMYTMFKNGQGTLAHKDRWALFDQILVSDGLLNPDYYSWSLYTAHIYSKPYLLTPRGNYKGYPFRSMVGSHFTNGYSDHLPVYIQLIRKKPNP